MKTWPDPTQEELDSLAFKVIWDTIKTWDINVPDVYDGYTGATGNHVVAILHAVKKRATEYLKIRKIFS